MRPDVETDWLVIGSGAGGSVVAYHLARSRERVVVLERGAHVQTDAMAADEATMIGRLYFDGGAQMNTDADMFVLQGSCVGGSTVLTNAVCFRMPEPVRREFANAGFELDARALHDATVRVESVLNVGPSDPRMDNPATARLAAGMRSLGLAAGRFHKSMLHCIGCGLCNIGCRYGRKLDAAQTFVPMALARGAELVTSSEAIRLHVRRGRVEHVVCEDLRDGTRFRIRARHVVLAAGAIHTPELLLKSGIRRDRAGHGTSFNAGAILFAEFDAPIDAHRGDQMCIYHMSGEKGRGYAIEQLHNPPASFALTLPGWYQGHHDVVRRWRRMTAAGALVPTAANGRVFLGIGRKLWRSRFDHAELEFQMREDDLATMREGLATTARIFFAAGASRVLVPTHDGHELRSPTMVDDALARLVRTQSDLCNFGSSHPQGGAAAGDDPRRSVVGRDFRVHGVGNLFVADASLFPSSVGVNPMISIMSVADLAAQAMGVSPPDEICEGPAYDERVRNGLVAVP
jgi:choline dehydrogenase-like flavoprotein